MKNRGAKGGEQSPKIIIDNIKIKSYSVKNRHSYDRCT